MNDMLKIIKARYACRAYTGEPVEQEKIKAIAQAALQAPSAFNKQPWHIIAITDKALIDEINDDVLASLKNQTDQTAYQRIVERGGKPYYNAPAMFLVLKDSKGGEWADIDCGIVAQNMALAATSLGLGNVIAAMCAVAFVQGERVEEFKARVNWPKGYEFGVGVLVGYPKATKAPHEIDETKLTLI